MIGHTISHYEIVEKLGEGGMGEVYKAEDTKLGRPIALKFLAPHLLKDEQARKRFEREARAAAALDHPNICTVHEIDEADGRTFIALAYLEGQTLRERIAEGPLKLNEALAIAAQIAEGLEAAHEKGVVHRDMKPENVMLIQGSRRLAKIMDFGLAQLAGTSKLTRDGATLGTMSYMSPEQAQGGETDRRSDIWSLGVMLYEMVAGQPPFKGEFDQAVIYSILNEPPEPLTAVRTGVPRELERIINKCLAKDPASRYQNATDLLVDLRNLSKESQPSASRVAAAPVAKSRSELWLPAAIVVGLAVVATVLWLGSRRPGDPPPLSATQLTSELGIESQLTFSPDGSQIAYVKDQVVAADIYVRLIGAGSPLRLTSHPKLDWTPAWSPDGRYIAFIRWGGEATADVMLVPALGGPERKVGETAGFGWFIAFGGGLAWSPDGRWLVAGSERLPYGLTLLSVETGERRLLTSPQSGLGDLGPAFSPDGRSLAFTRHVSGAITELYLLQLDAEYSPRGEPRQLTSSNRLTTRPVFTGDGSEIVFSSGPMGSARLWRIPSSGAGDAKPLLGVGASGGYPAISRDGRRLSYAQGTFQTNIWRRELSADGAARPPERVLSSTVMDHSADYSPSGERIVFGSNRTGNHEIWVSNADGSAAQPLTSFPGSYSEFPRWSPDGARIAFNSDKYGLNEVYVMDAGGGAPKRLTNAGGQYPTWSADGNWIYYAGGEKHYLYKVPSNGGEAVPVVEEPSWVGFESVDGQTLYYVKTTHPLSLWKRPLPDGDESQVAVPLMLEQNVEPAEQGVYFTPPPLPGEPFTLAFYRFATGEVETVLQHVNMPFHGLSVAPDGRSVLYSEVDDLQADIMLVDDFR